MQPLGLHRRRALLRLWLEVAVALAPGAASGAVVGDLDVVEVVQEDAP